MIRASQAPDRACTACPRWRCWHGPGSVLARSKLYATLLRTRPNMRHDARTRRWATLLPLLIIPSGSNSAHCTPRTPLTMVSTRSRTYPPTDAVAADSARTTTAQVSFHVRSRAHSTAAGGEEKRCGAVTPRPRAPEGEAAAHTTVTAPDTPTARCRPRSRAAVETATDTITHPRGSRTLGSTCA